MAVPWLSDINECERRLHNCSTDDPAPAKCVNLVGGFRCSCADYLGYRLDKSNYASCEGRVMHCTNCMTAWKPVVKPAECWCSFTLQILMSAVKAFLGAVSSVTTQLALSIVLAKMDIKILSWTTESALVWTLYHLTIRHAACPKWCLARLLLVIWLTVPELWLTISCGLRFTFWKSWMNEWMKYLWMNDCACTCTCSGLPHTTSCILPV